jgi:hypothetical protein
MSMQVFGYFFLKSLEMKSSCVVGVGGAWLTGIQWAADMAIALVPYKLQCTTRLV